MNINLTPTRIEITEGTELLARVKMFDDCASHIKIRALQNHASWPALSAAIQQALEQMHSEVNE
jgi:hypothetical protein